jgi:hypothetical protein
MHGFPDATDLEQFGVMVTPVASYPLRKIEDSLGLRAFKGQETKQGET